MPENTRYAISTERAYFAPTPIGLNTSSGGGLNTSPDFFIVENESDLSSIVMPQVNKTGALIRLGQNNSYDLAVYTSSGWVVKPTKGEPGMSVTGAKGDKGDKGDSGSNGVNGLNGSTGLPPEHAWDGTQLRFRNPNGSWGSFVDVKGVAGNNGNNGLNGAKGDMPAHEWDGQQIRFQMPNGSWGGYVNVRGATGLKGDTGDNGLTPHIGINGNWFIGIVDTGVKATGFGVPIDSGRILTEHMANGVIVTLAPNLLVQGITYIGNPENSAPVLSISYERVSPEEVAETPVNISDYWETLNSKDLPCYFLTGSGVCRLIVSGLLHDSQFLIFYK